jgi:phosphoglycolate phosphatase
LADLETLLFDLDGTLTDPSEGITRSIQAALEFVGREPPPAASLTRYIGPPLRDTFRELGARPAEVDSLIEAYRRRYIEVGMFENRVYPGIPELLAQLGPAGFQLYVITAKPQEIAEAILRYFDLWEFFIRIFGSDPDGRLSDKRELLAHARRIAGFSVTSSALVGDRDLDIFAARSHGIFAIGALWGFGSVGELEAAGAQALASSPNELLEMLAVQAPDERV